MEIEAGSVLANRGLNYGYGYGQGNFQGDGSAVHAAVRGNRDLGIVNAINENSRDQFLGNQIDRGHTSIIDSINTNNQFLSDRIWSQGIDAKFATVTAQFATLERAMIANQQATTAQLHAADLKAVECCCELKAGQATIIANQENARLQAAQEENQNLRLQIAIAGNGNGNGNGNS